MSRSNCRRRAFTLVELLVVILIIGVLLAILLPALSKARSKARDLSCASQQRQIATALFAYLIDARDVIFWRGDDPSIDGMDWYVYGGRETGNAHLGQVHPTLGPMFNRFQPRPLNQYVGDVEELFHCPFDDQPWPWASYLGVAYSHFELVGNSYNFNAIGYPGRDLDRGLAGVRYASITSPAETALFHDATVAKQPDSWHAKRFTNLTFADGHGRFIVRPSPDDLAIRWEP